LSFPLPSKLPTPHVKTFRPASLPLLTVALSDFTRAEPSSPVILVRRAASIFCSSVARSSGVSVQP